MNKHVVTLLLLVGIIAVLGASFFVGGLRQDPGPSDEAFGGTDAQVTEMLDEGGARPWFGPVVELGSSELESGLFAAQAGLGGIVLGYCVGRLQGRRRAEASSATAEPAESPAR